MARRGAQREDSVLSPAGINPVSARSFSVQMVHTQCHA